MRVLQFIFLMQLTFIINKSIAQNIVKNYCEGQVIVMFKSNVEPLATNQKVKFDNTFKNYFDSKNKPIMLSIDMNCWLYFLDEKTTTESDFILRTNNFENIKAIQLNHFIEERSTPNDSLFNLQWDLNNIGQNGGLAGADISALEAWDITTGGLTCKGDTIVVGVVDSGFDLNHEDLDFWKNYSDNPNDTLDNDNNGYKNDYNGWNAVNDNGSITSTNHGTHVSGTIGAIGNNNIGITGINWNVKIMPIKGSTQLESVAIKAYGYVLAQRTLYNKTNGAKGAFVVATNSSFGVGSFGANPNDFPIWCAFYDSLGAQGILSAAATANSAVNIDNVLDVPTACASNFLVAVTNTTNSDTKYASAGFGINTIDIGAPGVSTQSTYPNNNYSTSTGTSMASPHVAGAIALMLSAASEKFIDQYKLKPAETALIIKEQMMIGVDSLNSLSTYCKSQGRLNLFKAVSRIKNFPDSLLSIKETKANLLSLKINYISPNPATSFAEIEYNQNINSNLNIFIYDITGNQIYDCNKGLVNKGLHRQRLDLSMFSNGTYFIKLFNDKNQSTAKKLCIIK